MHGNREMSTVFKMGVIIKRTNEKPQVKGMQFVQVFAKIKMTLEMEVVLTPVLFSAQG